MDPPSTDGMQPSPLVTASVDGDETVSEVLVDAFLAAHVDVFEKEETLQDRIDADVLDSLDRETTRSAVLSFPIWEHRVVVRQGRVEIYRETDVGSICRVNR